MEFQRQTKRGKEAESKAQRTAEEAEAFAEAAERHAQAQAAGGKKKMKKMKRDGDEDEEVERSKLEDEARGATLDAEPPVPPPFMHNLDRAQIALESGNPYEAAAVPLRLAAIRIEGAKNLRPSFLSGLCRPYLDGTLKPDNPLHRLLYSHRLHHTLPGQPTSIPAILALTNSLGQDLTSFDLFSDIAAQLAPAASASSSSSSSAEDVDVVLRCQEKGRFFLKTSTEVGNGEGNGVVQGRLRNVLGGAESLEGSASIGTKTRKSFALALVSPLFASPDHSVSLSAFAQDSDLTSYASCVEGLQGVRAALSVNAGALGLHELAYEVQHRHVGRLLPTASMSMRRLAGHTVKSAVSHTVTSDTRDDPFMATEGRLLRLYQEYAGLGGDASHYKVEGEGQVSRAFGRGGWAASLSARGGALTTLNGLAPRFSDRFQLGGPVSLRMFRYNGLGPRDGADSLGGDAFWAVGASLLAPIPTRPHWPLKIHTFLNAGQLAQVHGREKGTAWRELGQPSSSFGLGLLYMQSGLRVELNAGLPLTARKGDGHRKGIQLGIGISFL